MARPDGSRAGSLPLALEWPSARPVSRKGLRLAHACRSGSDNAAYEFGWRLESDSFWAAAGAMPLAMADYSRCRASGIPPALQLSHQRDETNRYRVAGCGPDSICLASERSVGR